MPRYHFCEACGCPGVEREYRLCSSCAVLLDGLEDATVPGPPEVKPVIASREPGSDDDKRPALKPRQRTGRWLVWAANKRGRLRDAQAIGRERGFPRDMSQWSAGMVAIVVEALQRPTTPR